VIVTLGPTAEVYRRIDLYSVVLILEITVVIAWVLVQTDQSMCPWIHLCFITSFCDAHSSCRVLINWLTNESMF